MSGSAGSEQHVRAADVNLSRRRDSSIVAGIGVVLSSDE